MSIGIINFFQKLFWHYKNIPTQKNDRYIFTNITAALIHFNIQFFPLSKLSYSLFFCLIIYIKYFLLINLFINDSYTFSSDIKKFYLHFILKASSSTLRYIPFNFIYVGIPKIRIIVTAKNLVLNSYELLINKNGISKLSLFTASNLVSQLLFLIST